MTAPRLPPLPETIGGKYRVLEQVGKGGMATVYSAVHLGTDRQVAVKVMAPGELDCDSSSGSERSGSLTRFEREARIAGNLDTQHVTRVFDTGIDPTHGPFIVMELLTGEDLKDTIRRLGPLRPELALRVVAQACIGLARAHAIGAVHRDVKASNVFLANDEFGGRIVKVLDFGIAKGRRGDHVDAADPKTLTRTGAMLGSPHYMSPEQALGTKALDHRADIWSLGILLFKCLSGRTPFDDQDTVGRIIVAIVQGTPPSVQNYAPWVSPEITSVVGRALRGSADERFQSAQEMYEAIRALIPGGDLAITDAMLTEMTDAERSDVKPRLSMKITIPDGTLASRRLEEAARAATGAPAAAASGPRVGDTDSTIDGAIASLRYPSMRPHSLGSKIALVAVALGVCAVAAWGLSRGGHEGAAPPALAAASSASDHFPTPPSPSAAPAPERKVDLLVSPPVDSVEVDGVATPLAQGAVGLAGDLGSVHKVRLRAGNREVTVEVIIAEDGARPRVVGLPGARSAPSTPARKTPSQTPPPAKSAARFDTQFE